MADEGLHALAVNNRIAVRLVITPPEQQRQVITEGIKDLDPLFDKARNYARCESRDLTRS